MRNIIITGGELFNKGAQAMTYIAVDECKKRFPDHEVLVLSPMDLKRTEEEKNQYTFRFIGWYPLKFATAQSNPVLKILCSIRNRNEFRECEAIYRNCDLLIDISGYALGSNWNYAYCNQYLEHLEFAKAYNIPVCLMPQSFGPFDFPKEYSNSINKRIEDLLSYVKIIMAREKEGRDALIDKYNLNNVQLEKDLVLNNTGIELSRIFKREQDIRRIQVEKDSVGIVPNKRLLDTVDENELLLCYREVISYLIMHGKNVYIMSHASADQIICQNIYDLFTASERVHLIRTELSCIEYNEIVKKMSFMIASRFHAIVHAYKEGVPCIAIGWAIKYTDLLSEFGQQNYIFDTSIVQKPSDILEKIEYIDQHLDEEKSKILEHLAEVQEKNVFDALTGIIKHHEN